MIEGRRSSVRRDWTFSEMSIYATFHYKSISSGLEKDSIAFSPGIYHVNPCFYRTFFFLIFLDAVHHFTFKGKLQSRIEQTQQ